MNNIINANDVIEPKVKYRGSVKILYMDKASGKTRIIKKHNQGGPGLFSAICRMLGGLDVTDYVPSYIYGYNAIYSDENKNAAKQMFTQKITFASTPVLYMINNQGLEQASNSGEKANVVEYTFMVPMANLKSTSGNDSIKCLVLYNNRGDKCAQLNLESHEEIKLNLTNNILIYWKLKFE